MDIGPLGYETRHGFSDMRVGNGKGGGDRNRAQAPADEILCQSVNSIETVEDGGDVRKDRPRLRREQKPPGNTRKQLDLELALALLERGADGGLSHVQKPRRRRHGAGDCRAPDEWSGSNVSSWRLRMPSWSAGGT